VWQGMQQQDQNAALAKYQEGMLRAQGARDAYPNIVDEQSADAWDTAHGFPIGTSRGFAHTKQARMHGDAMERKMDEGRWGSGAPSGIQRQLWGANPNSQGDPQMLEEFVPRPQQAPGPSSMLMPGGSVLMGSDAGGPTFSAGGSGVSGDPRLDYLASLVWGA
jgi:hypothetical protein